jgi:hypothetical protein
MSWDWSVLAQHLRKVKFTLKIVSSFTGLVTNEYMLAFFSDTTCVLLPPYQAASPTPGILSQIVAALATRYNKTMAVVRHKIQAEQIGEWGKVRRTDGDGGDTMKAYSLTKSIEDKRDATFVRVSMSAI